MIIIDDIFSMSKIEKNDNLKNTCIAIGNFDGVHIGHQEIINSCVKKANKLNFKSVVFTFSNHTKEITKKAKFSKINTCEEKLFLFEQLGVDITILQNFSKDFANLSPNDFIELISSKLGVKYIFVGFNFKFGKDGKASIKELKEISSSKNIEVIEFQAIKKNGLIISSTEIRQAIEKNDFNKVTSYLGHPLFIIGKVIHGKKLGRKLGFPTANIEMGNRIFPPFGIYGAILKLKNSNEILYGVVNIGKNPTLKGEFSLEVHILNFNKDIYGEKLYIYLLKFIRNEKKFNNLDELINAISNDIKNWQNNIKECDYGYIFKH